MVGAVAKQTAPEMSKLKWLFVIQRATNSKKV